MRSIQTNPMIFMSDRLSVAFSFSRRGALTHHLLKQAVVALPLVGHVRSPRGIAAPAGAAGQGCISAKLPALPCLRQPATGSLTQIQGWNKSFYPLLVVRRISRRTERKQGRPVSGHPFQKGQGDLWRFIIWRLR